MDFCAVNYPKICSEGYEWIQSVRREHDHLFFDVIEPHFALVFPTNKVGKSTLIAHITEISARFSPFEAVMRCATLGDPDFMNHAHAFLIPDEGFSDVVRLHDALYTGPLRSELRLELPFVPHIGIASTPHVEECKDIVDCLNAESFEMRAVVDTISIIGYDGKTTWIIKECALGGGKA